MESVEYNIWHILYGNGQCFELEGVNLLLYKVIV